MAEARWRVGPRGWRGAPPSASSTPRLVDRPYGQFSKVRCGCDCDNHEGEKEDTSLLRVLSKGLDRTIQDSCLVIWRQLLGLGFAN